jgi:hypothetical protein
MGALQGNFGTDVQLKLRKHPNAYKMKPEFTCYNLFNNLDAIGYTIMPFGPVTLALISGCA